MRDIRIDIVLRTIFNISKNRASTVAGLLENYETIEEVIKSAEGAEGSALKENERYLESIQGRIDLFTNSLQEFWYNLLDSDMVGQVVDAGTKLINILGNITSGLDDSGLLKGIVSLLTNIIDLIDELTSGLGNLSTVLAGVLGVGLFKKIKGKNSGGRAKLYQKIQILYQKMQKKSVLANMPPNKLAER